jgi:hypothetical protein
LRTLILTFITIALIAAASWAHLHFNLGIEVTAAVVGLVGVAAAVVAAYPLRTPSGCDVADPYLSLSWLNDKEEFIAIHMEANVINTGDQGDVLAAVPYLFYRKDGQRGNLGFIFGARKVDASMGHTLPCPLEPGIKYLVEGSSHCYRESPLGKFILESPYEDFTLRCRFVFRKSRSITFRIRPFNRGKPRLLASWITELMFVKSKGVDVVMRLHR